MNERLFKIDITMKVTVLKWTKDRTISAEDGEVGKKINRYQSQYFINVLEMIRSNLDLNVKSALALQDSWVLNLNNNFETFNNQLSVKFINWRNFLSLVWRTNVINLETNQDISLILEVDSIEIFVIDRSLISNGSNRKNTRRQKIKATLEEDFKTPADLIKQDNRSVVAVKVFNETMSSNNFYELYFTLTKSNPFLFYQNRMEIFDSKYGSKENETIQKLYAKFKTQLSEMDIEDRKFFYGLRFNIIFSTQENFNEFVTVIQKDQGFNDNTFFNLLKDTA